MFRRWVGRAAPPQPDAAAWGHDANAAAASPEVNRIAALRARVVDPALAPDIAESQEEMLDGLERLLALAHAPALPVVATQHRVIGQAACHFLAPASLIDQVDAAGKLFVTAERLVFAAGPASAVQQWPWHGVAAITREERDVVVGLRGRPAAARVRLNTYGDALMVEAVAQRLRANRP
jgi:hypothetical protein